MKFNEKLIELRKKQGLSQEELGYKLNVTRQTVSKWELGSTTPEMDKLVEIGKIFNVSVDYLINDTQENVNNVIEDQTIKKDNSGIWKKIIKIVLIICAILIIVRIIFAIIGLTLFNKVSNEALDMFESTSSSIIGETVDTSDEGNFFKRIFKMFTNIFDNTSEIIMEESSKKMDEMEKQAYNQSFEMFSGKQKGLIVKNSIIDAIVSNAEFEDKEMTVKYNDIETKDLEEIKDLQTSLDSSKTYKVSYEYDEDGYIYKVLIEDVEEEEDVEEDVAGNETEGNTTVENNYTSTSTTTMNNGTKVHTTTSSSTTTSSTTSSSSSSSTSSSSSSSSHSSSNVKDQMQQNMDKAQQMQEQMQQNFESNMNKAQQMQSQINDMMQNH